MNRTGWSTSDGNECSWYGVTCTLLDFGSDSSLMQNAVAELDLSYNNVDGIWTDDLGLLSFLLRFAVEVNQLAGTIPSWLSQWSSLQELDVSENRRMGSIPSSLSQWSSLQTFLCVFQSIIGRNHIFVVESMEQFANL